MSYPSQTILRFRPSENPSNPYVAVVLATGGNILEVKRHGIVKKTVYSSVDEWLESMDERPTLDQLEAHAKDSDRPISPVNGTSESNHSDEKETVTKEEKKAAKAAAKAEEKAAKAAAKIKLNLVPKKPYIPAVQWTYHIHAIIKEACPKLLTQPSVIHAFNHLVSILLENMRHVYTTIPLRCHRYTSGIEFADVNAFLQSTCNIRKDCIEKSESSSNWVVRNAYIDTYKYMKNNGSTNNQKGYIEWKEKAEQFKKELATKILEAYQPLFELIKGDVIPYLHDRVKTQKDKETREKVIRLSEKVEQLQAQHEANQKQRQERIEYYEKIHLREMERYRTQISALINEQK